MCNVVDNIIENPIENPIEDVAIDSHANYYNRELSFIEFNRRVLAEAEDTTIPLLERLKFCTILSSNLDEFFMIRVAGLKGQVANNINELTLDGMTPREQLRQIREQLIPIYAKQSDIFINDILPTLQENQILVSRFSELCADSQNRLKQYFINSILPALTPIALSSSNPFPRLISKSLNVAVVLKNPSKKIQDKQFAFVQIPTILPRLIPMEWLPGSQFILIEQLIKEFAHKLFPGMKIEHTNTFRVTRDADIEIAEDEAEDLISALAGQLKTRRWGSAAVRLEHSPNMPKFLSNFLQEKLDLDDEDVYVYNRPLSLPDFMLLYDLDVHDLKDKPFVPQSFQPFLKPGRSIFEVMKHNDFLVHHPYDSFDSSVAKFISQASKDPAVVAIKITLYRTNRSSDIVKSLVRAAENAKSVVALVELKARFDEEKNIEWAKELERTGVHVVYGVPGLKTHSKIAVVVRKEKDKLKTYVHLATGNYNQNTAKLYTDVGLFTSNSDFARDAVTLFNHLTAYSHHTEWKKLIIAPDFLCEKTIEMIDRETERHSEENPGYIFAKMNSLAHESIIQALYRASNKGVKIKLLIRGICCLRPGIPGISENIEVRSIVGRFLEHSRIFYFKNGGKDSVYLSSADWMSRNMQRRVEILFPIEDNKLKSWLMEWLDYYWADNTKSWRLTDDGTYQRLTPQEGEEPFSIQEYFLSKIKHR